MPLKLSDISRKAEVKTLREIAEENDRKAMQAYGVSENSAQPINSTTINIQKTYINMGSGQIIDTNNGTVASDLHINSIDSLSSSSKFPVDSPK